MEIIIILLSIAQSIAISLGVGASTLAIINFFVAINDGDISTDERKLMGVVYIVLRVAMGAILVTSLLLALYHAADHGLADYLTAYKAALWTLIAVLFVNAILMTKHLISSTFGPAIQAGTWYTLGVVTALLPMNLHNFTYWHFLVIYLAALALTVTVVNAFILQLSPKK